MRWPALVLLLASCAGRPVVVETSEPRARPRSPAPAPPTAEPPPAPECPASLRAAHPLEASLGESIRPGTWHPTTEPAELGFAGGWRERFRVTEGPVELVGLNTRFIASVVMFTPHDGGVCVVNAWTGYFPGDLEEVRIAGTWTDGGRVIAVLQLRLEGEPATWLVLGADATHAWFPLEERGRRQLAVKELKLAPSGPKLYLDAILTRMTRFVLREDGHFERL